MDGQVIIFAKGNVNGISNVWVLPLSGDRKPFPYQLNSSPNESQAALSPNGRRLAYVTNATGRYEVFVQSFPDPSGGKSKVSAAELFRSAC